MTQENETNFTEILDALAKEFSSGPLQREEDGRVLFAIDDESGVALFTVDAEEAGVDALAVVIVLGPAPDDNAVLLRRLLCANYLGGETADGTLAIDDEADCLTLTRFFPLPVNAESFMGAFARLVNAARHWGKIVVTELANPEDGDENMMKV